MIPPDARGEGVAEGEEDTAGERVVPAPPSAVPTVAVPDVVDEQAVVKRARTRTTARVLRLAAEGGVRTIGEPYKPPMTEPCQALGSALRDRHRP